MTFHQKGGFCNQLSDHRRQRMSERGKTTNWNSQHLSAFHRRLILKLMRFMLISCQHCFLYCALCPNQLGLTWKAHLKSRSGRIESTIHWGKKREGIRAFESRNKQLDFAGKRTGRGVCQWKRSNLWIRNWKQKKLYIHFQKQLRENWGSDLLQSSGKKESPATPWLQKPTIKSWWACPAKIRVRSSQLPD